ncbi:MAG TPA: hypothetical protein VGL95_18870, partial [Acetobacteraceae bacterium]
MDFCPRYPWEGDKPRKHAPKPVEAPAPPVVPSEPKPRGRRPVATQQAAAATAGSPDWLYHHLTICGPAEPLGDFSRAARGAGVIPWQLDFARIEED